MGGTPLNPLHRYRKLHLHGDEPIYCDSPDKADVAHFTTDSGLRIGLMICFDINFQEPALQLAEVGVDAIAFPVAWVDELPFLTGIYLLSTIL